MVQTENIFFYTMKFSHNPIVFGILLKQEKRTFCSNFFHLIWWCRSWDMSNFLQLWKIHFAPVRVYGIVEVSDILYTAF